MLWPDSWGVNAGKGGTLKMDFQDKVLKCVDCGADFVFTAGEQLFFHDKQFKNEPKRCKNCKGKRAQALGLPQNGGNYQRVETKAVCSGCQRETTVPFKPTQGRPVFCRECFQQRKTSAATA
ncbi:MAG: zinc-ribbon domain containing protein [Candidatus Angelobacter sp.]